MSKKKFKPHSYYGNRSYFKASDFPEPRRMITEMFREEETQFSKPDRHGKKKPRLIAYFVGEEMGIVLSAACCAVLEQLTGSLYADDWIGVEVEVFNDLSIRNPRTGEYGAIRFRRPLSHQPLNKQRADSREYLESEAYPAVTGSQLTPEQEAEINALLR